MNKPVDTPPLTPPFTTPPTPPARPGRGVSQHDENENWLEIERRKLVLQRQRNRILLGLMLSVLAHLLIMFYLSSVHRYLPGRAGDPVEVRFAMLPDALEKLESTDLSDALSDSLQEAHQPDATEPAIGMEITESSSPDLEIAASGSLPALGGSGDGLGGDALGGGAGGASFFGISSTGTRFAYIADVSGSMRGERITALKIELARSVKSLPDFASFCVVLYSDSRYIPPSDEEWLRARPGTVQSFIHWLNGVSAGGGTQPNPAFQYIFSLKQRPDVIFFMTDGEIPDQTADEIAQFNRTGTKVVINTIAFGENVSQDQLKQIARDSGGLYRFVPAASN